MLYREFKRLVGRAGGCRITHFVKGKEATIVPTTAMSKWNSFWCRRIHQRPQQEQHNRVFEDIDGVGVRGERP